MSSTTTLTASLKEGVPPHVADFYRQSLRALRDAGIPFLVGGAFSLACYTGIRRVTKDLDLFILREDFERIARLMQQHGWRTELPYPHWLGKVHDGDAFIDLIFNSGNGVTPVDARWFHGNSRAEILGVPVRVANVEDSLLSKAFIMERERYDGGDIAHLLLARAERLDWAGLLERFGPHWRVLLAHLTLFGYIYPGERHRIPTWVMTCLNDRLADEMHGPPAASDRKVCAGTLLSREQYLHDVQHAGYLDGRLTPASGMTARDVAVWTHSIEDDKPATRPPPD
jgi:predicted nucleotidyltransferase